jgi:hypothetical protein
VRHRADTARLHWHWQARLGSVERLDLALLVNRKDHSVRRRIDVEADNVLELLGEFGSFVRQFERPDAMRGEQVRLKDALDRPQAHAPVQRVVNLACFGRFGNRPKASEIVRS